MLKWKDILAHQGTIWALIGFLYVYLLLPQIKTEVTSEIDTRKFMPIADAHNIIKEAVLEEREKQADNRTASLSSTIANALGVDREQIAPRISALIQFGEGEMGKHLEREAFWNDFKETRYISLLMKGDKLYFRWKDNDYLVRDKTNNAGQLIYYWIDNDGQNHFIGFISNLQE